MARGIGRLMFAAVLCVNSIAAMAADFPVKPVHLIVPFPPGGTIDIVARLNGAKLRDYWRQPIVVENRVGANGALAVDYVAKSAPDGHTLLVHSSLIVATQQLQRTPYDINRDLVAASQTATINFAVAASPQVGVSSLDEFVALAKKSPGRLNYSSGGNGSGTHLYAELLKRAAKIDLTHVPYKGDAPALQAVVSGEVDLIFTTTGNLLQHVKSGKLRPLLVTGGKPLDGFSGAAAMDVVYPGFGIDAWHGIFAPAATPKATLDQISADVRSGVLSPDLSGRFREMGFESTGLGWERATDIMRRDFERWGQIIRENNIRAD